jgi:hypothetical protein
MKEGNVKVENRDEWNRKSSQYQSGAQPKSVEMGKGNVLELYELPSMSEV